MTAIQVFGYTMTTKKEFRIRAKRFFLTYPQLPKEIDNLEEVALINFEEIFKMSRDDFRYVTCVELHEDGNPHLHVYLEFNSVQRIYSPTKLDLIIEGHEEPFHGNYQAVKNEHGTVQYIIKASGSLDSVNTNKALPVVNGVYYSSCDEHLHAILKNKGLAAARETLYNEYPTESVRRGNTILLNLISMSEYLQQIKATAHIHIYDIEDFKNISDAVWQWVENPTIGTLVLYGPSGTGKTELAKALLKSMKLPYIIIGDKNSLRNLDLSIHKAIIFDDMNFAPVAREEMISLLDTKNGGDVRILYNVVNIPGHLAKIFTTNRPQELFNRDSALERRAIPVEVLKPVWRELPDGDHVQIEDRAYRSYTFGQGDIHPALWYSNAPSASENTDRVVGVERPEPTLLEMTGDDSGEVVAVEHFKSSTAIIRKPKILLLECGKIKSRRGRPKSVFIVKTTLSSGQFKKKKFKK